MSFRAAKLSVLFVFCAATVAYTAPPNVRVAELSQVSQGSTHRIDWAPIVEAAQAKRAELDRFYTAAASHPVVWTTPRTKPAATRTKAQVSGSHLSSHRGYATAEACVAAVENGGDYGASTNPTHKGKYQFSRATWIAYGGTGEEWDSWDVTPARQEEIFRNAWDSGGQSNWLPYDHC